MTYSTSGLPARCALCLGKGLSTCYGSWTGYRICPICDGDGRHYPDCYKCHGVGLVVGYKRRWLGLFGKLKKTPISCEVCQGTGMGRSQTT